MSTTQPQIEPGALNALLNSAAFAPLPNLGWLRVTGSDRVRWLNGMVTNNIAVLKPGEGCYNFFLNNQGRIQGDATAWLQEDSILLQTALDRIPALIAMLDRFIIMDDVELHNLSKQGQDSKTGQFMDLRVGLSILGPNAITLLRQIDFPAPHLNQLELATIAWHGSEVDWIASYSPLIPRFEIWSSVATRDSLMLELTSANVSRVTAEDLEALRLLEGTPLYATDIRNTDSAKDLPQETAQTRALHFAKGCYLGQEIVERIRSRGNVHRTFTGFILTGTLPPAGTALTGLDTKTIGELTSVAQIDLPHGPVQLALGYIRREALDRGAPIHYPGGEATPSSLPFSLAASPAPSSASESQTIQE